MSTNRRINVTPVESMEGRQQPTPAPVPGEVPVRPIHTPQDYATKIEMIKAGAIRPEASITRQHPFERAGHQFHASTSGKHLTVVIRP